MEKIHRHNAVHDYAIFFCNALNVALLQDMTQIVDFSLRFVNDESIRHYQTYGKINPIPASAIRANTAAGGTATNMNTIASKNTTIPMIVRNVIAVGISFSLDSLGICYKATHLVNLHPVLRGHA